MNNFFKISIYSIHDNDLLKQRLIMRTQEFDFLLMWDINNALNCGKKLQGLKEIRTHFVNGVEIPLPEFATNGTELIEIMASLRHEFTSPEYFVHLKYMDSFEGFRNKKMTSNH